MELSVRIQPTAVANRGPQQSYSDEPDQRISISELGNKEKRVELSLFGLTRRTVFANALFEIARCIYILIRSQKNTQLVGKPSVYIKSVDAFRADQPPCLRMAFSDNRASEKDNAIDHLIFLN